MTDERRPREVSDDERQALFVRALELDGAQRRELLEEIGADDPDLRSELESLLAAHAQAGDFLEHASHIPTSDAMVGARIGAYRLTALVGAGGMGQVYRGERDDGVFEQTVAIKLIKQGMHGMGTADLLERFDHERQVLAQLEHPNIARLLDGGATDEGIPYLVMEFVDGAPFDAYCERHGLEVQQRLGLFREVCEAVQYAHRNLVVHRDLKPSNILVTEDGAVKLLDFGIAKVIGPGGNGEMTVSGQQPMTPKYASPEQMLRQPITTATDVYALGVILYELLTGNTPYRLETDSGLELAQAICDQEPDRPSRAHRQVTGDLDWIVLAALRKEPERRYASVERLSRDLRNYRDGLPVSARPDTVAYRASKFVRRNRVLVGSLAVVFVALLTTAIVSVRLTGIADDERTRAEHQALVAGTTSDFLQEMLALVDPKHAQGRDVTVLREMLDAASARMTERFGDLPEVAATVHITIGKTYLSLALHDEAEHHIGRALDVRRELYGEQDPETAQAHFQMARVQFKRGRHEAAQEHASEALVVYEAEGDKRGVARVVHMNAQLAHAADDFDNAVALYEEVISLHEAIGSSRDTYLSVLGNLAVLYSQHHKYDLAEPLLREVADTRQQRDGEMSPAYAVCLHNLATCLRRQDKYDEAEEWILAALAIQREVLEPGHPKLLATLGGYASLLERLERYPEAEQMNRDVLEQQRIAFGDVHKDVGTTLNNLGGVLRKMKRLDDAEATLLEAADVYRGALGERHFWVSIALGNLADVHEEAGDYESMERVAREALGIQLERFPDGNSWTAKSESQIAPGLVARGEFEEAETLLLESVDALTTQLGPGNGNTRRAMTRLVRLYEAWERPDDAKRWRTRLEEPVDAGR